MLQLIPIWPAVGPEPIMSQIYRSQPSKPSMPSPSHSLILPRWYRGGSGDPTLTSGPSPFALASASSFLDLDTGGRMERMSKDCTRAQMACHHRQPKACSNAGPGLARKPQDP